MKFGVVIHGPEVIDSGQTKRILDHLELRGSVNAILGGTMGKTAVIDASMENRIDISKKLKPSESIDLLSKTCDIVILMNHAKSFETGTIFGGMVVSNLEHFENTPIIQIERPGHEDGRIICWNEGSEHYAHKFSKELGINISRSIKNKKVSVRKEGRASIRSVSGALPGENILVNGFVIGRAHSSNVKIILEDGFVKDIEGGTIKEHGVDKLHRYEKRIPVDIGSAWVKTGNLRRSNCSPRMGKRDVRNGNTPLKAVLIDHEAENCFDIAKGADIAVTIGDDTTAIAADILYRLGIPVIGITDGDSDGLHSAKAYPGSLILRLESGHDDIIGKIIRKNIFLEDICALFNTKESFKRNIKSIAGDKIIHVYNF